MIERIELNESDLNREPTTEAEALGQLLSLFLEGLHKLGISELEATGENGLGPVRVSVSKSQTHWRNAKFQRGLMEKTREDRAKILQLIQEIRMYREYIGVLKNALPH